MPFALSRGLAQAPVTSGASTSTAPRSRTALTVEANKKVVKKTQVVLNTPVAGLGAKGDLATVPLGFYRNFLAPTRAASRATAGILAQADKAKEDEVRKAGEVKAKAGAMKTALATIGKFVIKKKAGEGDAIFGAVTAAEVIAAIEQQTGRVLDKRGVTLPDIKTLGTYDVTVRLHPEVVGEFKVVVQKEKAA